MAVTFGTARRGLGRAAAPPSPTPLLAVPNLTAHPSTTSVPSEMCKVSAREMNVKIILKQVTSVDIQTMDWSALASAGRLVLCVL